MRLRGWWVGLGTRLIGSAGVGPSRARLPAGLMVARRVLPHAISAL